MDPKHLVYLATIIERGSITAASEHLQIAQPTLTRAMATLEMQAGTRLFSRSRFGVKSTPVGEALAREGRAIKHSMDIVREQVSRFKVGLQDELRIAAGPLLGVGVMPEIIDRMTQAYPHIALTFITITPTSALDAMLSDEFDVLLAPAPDHRSFEGIHREVMIRDQIGVFCSSTNPLVSKTELEVSDLESSDWLSLGIASTFEREVLELLMSAGIQNIRTKVAFRNDASVLVRLLSRGRYLAVLPRVPVAAIDERSALVELPLNLDIKVSRDLYIWVKESVMDQPAYQLFYKIASEVLQELKNKADAKDFS